MSKISKERKITYYIGLGLIVLGFILFISVFFSVADTMNDPMMAMMEDKGPNFTGPILGFVLIILGSIITNIGAKGAAGSGILLDPDRAREDLKPYNEAKGGMINDVISNIDVVDKLSDTMNKKEVIKIKCRSCGALNEEDATYCKCCGEKI